MLRIWLQRLLFPTCDIPVDTDRENLWNIIGKLDKRIKELENELE
jgi:hypothetical protein